MFYEPFKESTHTLFIVVSKDHTAIHLPNTILIDMKYSYSIAKASWTVYWVTAPPSMEVNAE